MSLYTIGDLHLSFSCDKPMDVFGGAWTGYLDKLRASLSLLQPDDLLVMPGDLTWAMDMEEALPDFRFLHDIGCGIILLKGNHDYWWSTAAKFHAFCAKHGFDRFSLLNNNCFHYEGTAICGSRGWTYEAEKHTEHDQRIYNRELQRLEMSLRAAGDDNKICFLHYPPIYKGYENTAMLDLMRAYGVKDCFYGHLHSESHRLAIRGEVNGIRLHLVSADYLNFQPLKIDAFASFA